tara:strand:+ start:887 stop:1393 length:507 start_codon:yes stop_codon:yes gene_type:complete
MGVGVNSTSSISITNNNANIQTSLLSETVEQVNQQLNVQEIKIEASNSANNDVFVINPLDNNLEVILPTNISENITNYIITFVNSSVINTITIRSIDDGDDNYSDTLKANIYSWSYPSYTETGDSGEINLDVDNSNNKIPQSNLRLPPKRLLQLRYLLIGTEINFYEI